MSRTISTVECDECGELYELEFEHDNGHRYLITDDHGCRVCGSPDFAEKSEVALSDHASMERGDSELDDADWY